MKRLEEIGNKYNRLPEQVEYDLMSILKWKNKEGEKPDIYGLPYYHKLVELLEVIGCLELDFLDKVITSEGKRLVKQGFIICDFKTPKVEKQRKILRERLSLLIGFLGVIVGIVAMFFPRHDTLSQTDSVFREFNGVIIQDTIDLASQVEEINQTTDSTKQQNNNCKCENSIHISEY